MRTITIPITTMAAAAVLLLGATTAAVAQGTGPNAAGDGPTRGPSLAASANRALAKDDVPSARDDVDVKAAADADLARRDVRPRLQAQRQNLKEDAAARALAQQRKPSTYDQEIQMGDKDHTEQVTNLKITVKK